MRNFPNKPPAVQDSVDTTAASGEAGAAPIYQADLIPRLRGDHQQLLALYTEVRQAFELADYPRVTEKLSALRSSLQQHLQVEHNGLYAYLDHNLGQTPDQLELTRRFNHEMEAIGRVAMSFLDTYATSAFQPTQAAAFAREFAHIGQLLTDRIKKEELILYPLYLP